MYIKIWRSDKPSDFWDTQSRPNLSSVPCGAADTTAALVLSTVWHVEHAAPGLWSPAPCTHSAQTAACHAWSVAFFQAATTMQLGLRWDGHLVWLREAARVVWCSTLTSLPTCNPTARFFQNSSVWNKKPPWVKEKENISRWLHDRGPGLHPVSLNLLLL